MASEWDAVFGTDSGVISTESGVITGWPSDPGGLQEGEPRPSIGRNAPLDMSGAADALKGIGSAIGGIVHGLGGLVGGVFGDGAKPARAPERPASRRSIMPIALVAGGLGGLYLLSRR